MFLKGHELTRSIDHEIGMELIDFRVSITFRLPFDHLCPPCVPITLFS